MKVRSLVFGVLSMLALSVAFTACSNEDDNSSNDDGSLVELPKKRAFILNEGKSKANNAGIAFYAPDKDAKDSKNNFIANLYKDQNGKELGDGAMDIIEYDDYLFATVYGSSLLLKLNQAGVEQKRVDSKSIDGQPRFLAAEDGKVYVSLSSGKVARVDANTLTVEAYAEAGKNPEQMAIEGGKLYVANSGFGYDNRVSVIDLKTFKKDKDLTVAANPNYLLEANDEIYVISWPVWNDPTTAYSFQRIKTDGTVEVIAEATYFAEHNDIIYLIYSITDWTVSPAVTKNTFFTYNAKTHTLNNTSFLKNMPEKLASAGIYSISVSDDGDIYLTTSDFTTNGDAYRFSSNGTFIEKFDCGGINPRKILFVD